MTLVEHAEIGDARGYTRNLVVGNRHQCSRDRGQDGTPASAGDLEWIWESLFATGEHRHRVAGSMQGARKRQSHAPRTDHRHRSEVHGRMSSAIRSFGVALFESRLIASATWRSSAARRLSSAWRPNT